MSSIVMDALSHQAIRAQGTEATAYGQAPETAGRWRGVRLAGFEAELARQGQRFRFAEPDDLLDADIFIVASRSQSCMFSADALAKIAAFVRGGGGLLLMANHRNFILPQQQVAAALDLPIEINDISIVDFPPISMTAHALATDVGSIRVRNTSSLRVGPAAETLAYLKHDPRHVFAALCICGDGRVVVTGDSGFIASRDDAGLDLFAAEDNARFVSNALAWLARH